MKEKLTLKQKMTLTEKNINIKNDMTLRTKNNNYLVVAKIKHYATNGKIVTDYRFFYFDAEGHLLKETDSDEYKFLSERVDYDLFTTKAPWRIRDIIANYMRKNNYRIYKPIGKKAEKEILSAADERYDRDVENLCYVSYCRYVKESMWEYNKAHSAHIAIEIAGDEWYDDVMLGGVDNFNAIKVSYRNNNNSRFNPNFKLWDSVDWTEYMQKHSAKYKQIRIEEVSRVFPKDTAEEVEEFVNNQIKDELEEAISGKTYWRDRMLKY